MPTQLASTRLPAAVVGAAISETNVIVNEPVTSNTLLGERGICVIVHNAERYVLRRTRNNKLILTK
jgi:hemin uptake protein HemP